MISQIGVVSHHLQSLLGAIELAILCTFICRVGYFDACIKGGFTIQIELLTYLLMWGKKLTNCLHGMKQLAFLINFSTHL